MEDTAQTKHYCNVTFLTIGDIGPDGQPIEQLLRCSRCQETYYCGREQQRDHWKIHKKVCRPTTVDVQEAAYLATHGGNLSDVSVALVRHFNPDRTTSHYIHQRMMGRPFCFLLRKLQSLVHGTRGYSPSVPDVRMLQDALRCFVSVVEADNGTMELFWAIPGMTTYFLNLELISDAMCQRKRQGVLPTTDECDFQGFDPSFQVRTHFSAIIGYFMLASIFRAHLDVRTRSTYEHGYRRIPLAVAACRKMMQWYKDPYTRVSIPSQRVTSAQVACVITIL